jgi:hypothetical protein
VHDIGMPAYPITSIPEMSEINQPIQSTYKRHGQIREINLGDNQRIAQRVAKF